MTWRVKARLPIEAAMRVEAPTAAEAERVMRDAIRAGRTAISPTAADAPELDIACFPVCWRSVEEEQ